MPWLQPDAATARRGRSRLAKFLTDPIWWLYLFWLPDFFSRNYGLSLLELGPPLIVIYLRRRRRQRRRRLAVVALIRARLERQRRAQDGDADLRARGRADRVRARACRACGRAVALVSLATAAHQGWSANCFTLASDMFPRQAVGSVVGLGGFAGAVGGMLIAKVTGYVLQMTGSYTTVLMIAGGRVSRRACRRAAAHADGCEPARIDQTLDRGGRQASHTAEAATRRRYCPC